MRQPNALWHWLQKRRPTKKEATGRVRDSTATNMAAMFSIVDTRCQEMAGPAQYRAVAKIGTLPVLPPLGKKALALMMPPLATPMAVSSSPSCPTHMCGHGPFHHGGSPHATPLIVTPLHCPSTRVKDPLQKARCCARPRRCTSQCHRPCAPSPPNKILPSHPHPTLEGLSTPTVPPTLLARATSRSGHRHLYFL
jgi:hypothetical protein